MLELRDIKKDYPMGATAVHALKGVSIQFRRSEFVSILGPSGCGKTTLLNIIGGLDQYTDGDLIINGRSTKSFQDRDWDAYRNHSVGFVFQSYNLIPHQTVLRNVELALTLSGVSRAERRDRAIEALEKVGLGSQLFKKPSEMSGGQMQRVAIARAIVNNPDIILADEPTGALDTETSVQVMELLKEISKDRLIVMVTHNPALAEQYSSRIIRVLDGELKSDSNPLSPAELEAERAADNAELEANRGKKIRKPSMSVMTSFGLSLKNLFTKKGRTTLTAFAGSIGIIGIALILSVSRGMTDYIDVMQENALSAYPLSIQATNIDLTSLIQTFMNLQTEQDEHERDAVYEKPAVRELVSAVYNLDVSQNDLKTFKRYLEEELADPASALYGALSGIQYSYNISPQIYTRTGGEIVQSDTTQMIQKLLISVMGADAASASGMMGGSVSYSQMSSMMGMGGMTLWQEMLPGKDGAPVNELITRQYELIYGAWPAGYDQVVLVVDENNELDDMTLYALGLIPEEEMEAIANGEEPGEDWQERWTYEEICAQDYRVILPSACYSYDEATGLYSDLRQTDAGLQYLYDNALRLQVTGIIRKNPDVDTGMLSGKICYTSGLIDYMVEQAEGSEVVAAQKASPSRDVLTGLPFASRADSLTKAEKEQELRAYIDSLDQAGQAEVYVQIMSLPDEELIGGQVDGMLDEMSREDMVSTLSAVLTQQMSVSQDQIDSYLDEMRDEDLRSTFSQLLAAQMEGQYAQQAAAQLALLPDAQKANALALAMDGYTPDQWAEYYEVVMDFSESTCEDNLAAMGSIDLDSPAAINLYAASFNSKDTIEEVIAAYNAARDELHQISYTDYVGLLMSTVTSIINAITYVLVAFVAISLVVSSIMIGVITLISVQERTREIGILRAIGASKRDVSVMFNAETVIIGFSSGLIGVVVTYLLCFPISAVMQSLSGIHNIYAVLPLPAAVILVGISVLLTLISGLIPSRSAAKKDPVVALRSE
ncbi:MAG TPA: ABC transporter ATP-binding protein/permease [Candidatus Faecalibacterium intestinigallinarum]|uniref:ABC transporter ATP-binding protein/permease n=1 Tax=Candidatus Faecalibacterium intestinigallinarum TaxID=2838581 RepID=A0A9D1Q8G8_9FIRM|nr:ABC transporter ATP-binding protein/permease [Candidatus Faecalibacterium intestinigallinarum]